MVQEKAKQLLISSDLCMFLPIVFQSVTGLTMTPHCTNPLLSMAIMNPNRLAPDPSPTKHTPGDTDPIFLTISLQDGQCEVKLSPPPVGSSQLINKLNVSLSSIFPKKLEGKSIMINDHH